MRYPKLIGLLLVFASIVAMVALYAFDITFLYEPKHLLGVANTLFTAIIPVIVAFLRRQDLSKHWLRQRPADGMRYVWIWPLRRIGRLVERNTGWSKF